MIGWSQAPHKLKKGLTIALMTALIFSHISGYPPNVSAAGSETINLLNSGFEDIGVPQNWTVVNGPQTGVQSSTDQVHSGAVSVKLSDPSSAASAGLRSLKIPVTAGETYEATVYSYNTQGGSSLYLEFFNASGGFLTIPTGGNTTLNQWSQIKVLGVAPVGAAYATLRLYQGTANIGTAYFDDATFGAVTENNQPVNQVTNSGFEAGGIPKSWAVANGPQNGVETSTDHTHGGVYSVKLTDNADNNSAGLRSSKIPVTPGVTYETSVYSYNTKGESSLYLEFFNAGGSFLSIATGYNVTLNEWNQIIVRGTAPQGAAYATARLYLGTVNVGTAYFDDAAIGVVSLEEIRLQLLEKVGSVQDELEAVSSHIRSGSVAEDQALRNQSEELADKLGSIEDQGELASDASVLGNLIVETGSISLWIKRLNNFVEARNARPEAPFGLVKADAMELVYPKEIPCQCSTDPAQLSLAQGEYESIQAVVMPYGESLHNMSAQITSVVGPDGAEVTDSILRASIAPLGSVYVRKSSFYILPALEDRPSAYEGWIPDPIRTDLSRVDVAAFDMQPFWIELYASNQAKPGTYRVSVSFSADGTDTEVMEIDAVVWPFKIQDRPELATSMTMNPIQLKTLYGLTDGAEFDQMHEKYIDFLETFKIEPDLIYTQTPPSVEDLLKIKNKWGLRQFNFYYIYPGWLNLDINNPATWQPEIDRIVQEIGSALKMYEDAGLAEYGYIYGFDESRGAQLLLAKEIFTQIKQHFPNLPIMSTLIDSTLGAQSGLAGLIDIWVPSVDGFNQTAQAEAQNRGDQVYWYTHAGVQSPFPNWFNGYAPSDTRILLGPMSHKMDVDGFLYYNITRWPNRGPMQDGVLSNWDARTWNDANGDGSLFYPGQNGPLASQRIQNFRDGMEDYNLLNMLQTYMERASGVSESVLSAAQSLLKADTVVTSRSVYTKDPSVYRQWRDAVANMIGQLDTAAPKWPDGGKLSVTEATYSSIALQWPSATDDQAVEEYRIYVDGVEHPHPIQSDGRDNYPFMVSGLTDGTTYNFSVKAVDEVGHMSEVLHLSASTPSNINLVEARLESHIASGDIKQPLASQLTNHFKQAVNHLEKGQMPQAIHSFEVFLEHLGSEAHADRINPQVKAALQSNVQVLMTQWQE